MRGRNAQFLHRFGSTPPVMGIYKFRAGPLPGACVERRQPGIAVTLE